MQINLESLLICLKYRSYNDFDNELTDQDYNNIRYSYRVLYVPKAVNRKGQADKVIEFIPANSPVKKD
jgi:hypothetical protein